MLVFDVKPGIEGFRLIDILVGNFGCTKMVTVEFLWLLLVNIMKYSLALRDAPLFVWICSFVVVRCGRLNSRRR